MLAVDKNSPTFLYLQVTELIAGQIQAGALRPGDRLPSLRRLSTRLGLSIPTIKQGYMELERQGRVESRPQSGYYVRAVVNNPLVRPAPRTGLKPVPVRHRSLMERVYDGIHRSDSIGFGIANPSMVRPAAKGLHRAMKRVMARAEQRSLGYAPANGEPELIRQIAYRYLDLGGRVEPEGVIVTNGGQEALAIALSSVAGARDIIAVESPTYLGLLELIESLGMLAVEIETCPKHGVSLSALEEALDRHDIKACVFATSINNPLGSVTTDEHREQLVELLEDRGIPLVEDDVYGDLMFDGSRPKPAQSFSRRDLVLTCGSFSKTVAPGYRIGWLLPGRFGERARRLKRAISVSSGMLQQLTLSEYIAAGDYDRQLKALRPALAQNAQRMSALIAQHFPGDTRVSQPGGGSVLWLELSPRVDSERLFDAALERSIAICPGLVFSPSRRYRHFIRLSFGFPWSAEVEAGIRTLGELVAQMSEG